MKKYFIFLALILLFSGNKLQAQHPCSATLNTAKFKQNLEMIRSMHQETKQLQRAKELAGDFCLSSAQVREIAEIFYNDFNRLDFVQSAFQNITDKENIYEVYDAFAYFSNVMRLHDFIQGRPSGNPLLPPPPPQINIPFLSLNYPDYQTYMGASSCQPPLSEMDFMILATQVYNQSSEAGRLLLANQLVQENCLSTAQVMRIAGLLAQEKNRLALAKNAFRNTFDIGNYNACNQLFSHLPYRRELQDFINQPPIPGLPPPPPCMVSPEEAKEAVQSIKKQKFNSTRITVAKQILSAKKCFSTQQIKEIVSVFDFEESKLEIAKYAYDFCMDKQNYFSLNDIFSFSSSVEELSKYLQSKH